MRPTLLLLFLAAPAFAQNADVQKELMQRQCLKRKLQPDEIARATLFFASDEASACTNQQYVVDGGWV